MPHPSTEPVAVVVDHRADLVHIGRGEVIPSAAALSLTFREAWQLVRGLRGVLLLIDPRREHRP